LTSVKDYVTATLGLVTSLQQLAWLVASSPGNSEITNSHTVYCNVPSYCHLSAVLISTIQEMPDIR